MINKKLIVFPIQEKVVLNLVFQWRRIYRGICIPLSAARSKAVTWLSGLCLPISTITSAHQLSTDCLLIHLLSPFSYLSHSQGPLSTDVQQISRSSLFSLFTVASNHLPCTLKQWLPKIPSFKVLTGFHKSKKLPRLYILCILYLYLYLTLMIRAPCGSACKPQLSLKTHDKWRPAPAPSSWAATQSQSQLWFLTFLVSY